MDGILHNYSHFIRCVNQIDVSVEHILIFANLKNQICEKNDKQEKRQKKAMN